jgi:hypothetical protein
MKKEDKEMAEEANRRIRAGYRKFTLMPNPQARTLILPEGFTGKDLRKFRRLLDNYKRR